MNMMTDMLNDMITKAIPPEVMALISPENIKDIGDKIGAFMTELRDRLSAIEAAQLQMIERMDNGERDAGIGDDIANGSGIHSGDGSDKPSRTRTRRSRTDSAD